MKQNTDDLISREEAIAIIRSESNISMQNWKEYDDECSYGEMCAHDRDVDILQSLPSVQPESYQEKLKEIADVLSEKFAYMHTCLNERDIILGYLGVKHSNEIHCNTDCTNAKCESYHFNKRLPSAQPETCAYWDSESNFCALHRPSAQPFSEEEIQKIQDLEQAGIEKAFELGRQDAMSVIVSRT